MARELPTIEFAGTAFTVDIRLEEFRQKDAPWNRISFDDMAEKQGSEGYTLAFDSNTGQAYKGELFKDSFPKHVVLIEVPSLAKLDPVGLARSLDLEDDTFLNKEAGTKRLR